MLGKFVEFLKDEEGQTSTEYILLVAVVAMIVFKFKDIAVGRLESLTKNIFDTSESNIVNELNSLQ